MFINYKKNTWILSKYSQYLDHVLHVFEGRSLPAAAGDRARVVAQTDVEAALLAAEAAGVFAALVRGEEARPDGHLPAFTAGG